METTTEISAPAPVIPTLVEASKDGLYLVAYCPVCDKSEKSKVDYPGQPRGDVASVARIRAHLAKRHGKRVRPRAKLAAPAK